MGINIYTSLNIATKTLSLLEVEAGAEYVAQSFGTTRVLLLSHAHESAPPRLCIPSEFRRIPMEFGQKSPAGKNVKVQSIGKRYNTILVISVHFGWYLSTWFLHVEKARTYSK